jgi:hypothetical protein
MDHLSNVDHMEDCSLITTYHNKLYNPTVIDDETYCVSENGDIIKISS